jgi:hypothetical protein
MSIPSILGHGVFLISVAMLSLARWRLPSYQPRRHRHPGSHSLAGVPLRILLSDRSGPGAVLRYTLIVRPSTRD